MVYKIVGQKGDFLCTLNVALSVKIVIHFPLIFGKTNVIGGKRFPLQCL